jgi:hypothetical protein
MSFSTRKGGSAAELGQHGLYLGEFLFMIPERFSAGVDQHALAHLGGLKGSTHEQPDRALVIGSRPSEKLDPFVFDHGLL